MKGKEGNDSPGHIGQCIREQGQLPHVDGMVKGSFPDDA